MSSFTRIFFTQLFCAQNIAILHYLRKRKDVKAMSIRFCELYILKSKLFYFTKSFLCCTIILVSLALKEDMDESTQYSIV